MVLLQVPRQLQGDLGRVAHVGVDAQLQAAGYRTNHIPVDSNNIGPRLGIAWTPLGNRTVVRAGYGVFYGRTPSIMIGTGSGVAVMVPVPGDAVVETTGTVNWVALSTRAVNVPL